MNARVGYALPNKGELSLTGRFQDGHLGIPFATVFPDFDPNREQDQQLWLLSLEWRQPWTSIWEHSLRVSGVDETLSFRDQPDPAHPFAFTSDISSRRIETEWYHFIKPVPWNTITAGGEYRNEVGEVEGSYSQTMDSWALVLQDQIALFDRLFVTGGVRYDGNSVFEDKATGARGGLLSRQGDGHAAEGRAGGRGSGRRRSTSCSSRRSRRARRSAIRISSRRRARAGTGAWSSTSGTGGCGSRATYFRNDFTNLIQSTLTDPVNFCFQAQNVGKARSEGVELEASVTPIDGLVLAVAYTYTDSEDRTTGNPLPRVAPNALSVTATWEPLAGPHALRRGAGDVEPVRGAGSAAEPGVHRRQRGGRVPAADQALGVPVEHHAPRARDEPLQRGLLRGGRLPGARDARGGRHSRHLRLSLGVKLCLPDIPG